MNLYRVNINDFIKPDHEKIIVWIRMPECFNNC